MRRCGRPTSASPTTPEALAEALLGFLEDPARRARVGAENRRVAVEHHQLARQCARMGEAFQRATSG